VAAAFELAVTARIDEADLVEQMPAALRGLDPATRVGLWLTDQGWSEADAVAAVTIDDEDARPALDAVSPAARQAVSALALVTPEGLGRATADAWHEWQGIGLTIPERHPLTAVLSRLDAPLGRMGDALGRAGRTARTTRRRRARAASEATPAATPPPPVLLPIGATDAEASADTNTDAGPPAPDPEPFGPRIAAAAAAAASTPIVGDLEQATAAPAPADPTPARAGLEDERGDDHDREHDDEGAPALFAGPEHHDLDRLDRRSRPRPVHVVTAGSTPTRTRVLAALAAGILTASALGSLLTAAPTEGPGSRSEQVAAAADTPSAGGQGDLLDDDDAMVPAANVTDADDARPTTTTAIPGAAATGPAGSLAGRGGAGQPPSPAPAAPSGGGAEGSGGGDSGGSGGGAAPTGGAAAPAGGSGGPGGPGGSGGSGGGSGTGGGAAPAPTQPPATNPPPAPTTPPPAPTTPPPTTTTPPPTTQPGPVCGLLPVLCPGAGLVP